VNIDKTSHMNCLKVDYMLFDAEENKGNACQLTTNTKESSIEGKIYKQLYNDKTHHITREEY
jgi:hypothetical protein